MVAQNVDRQRVENLGPAERIIQTLTAFTDHLQHGRPGMVVKDARSNTGVRWSPVTWVLENDQKVAYQLDKVGTKTVKTRLGILGADNQIREGNKIIGEYRKPGLFPEVATYLYRQIAEVYKLDNEFAAHWASWSFPKEHRDLKVLLAAFMLVQSRAGDPVRDEHGGVMFNDDDFRAVGEAMCLIRAKDDINPKLLLRIGEVLDLPGVAQINRELGFGKSARKPAHGRYNKAIEKWLAQRERNPKMLEGLVKAGFRNTVMDLARRVGYKPTSPQFFQTLRWKQKQSADGRRELAIGMAVSKAESWEGMTEGDICQRIVDTKPNWKRVVGLLPASVGMTRAIVAAAIESGSFSDADLIISTPTLEELGLLTVQTIKDRWQKAVNQAENQRAANIAKRVKNQDTVEILQAAADKATQKALEEVTRDLRIYVVVDKSGSMEGAIERAKDYLAMFLQAFPLGQLHVSVFNTVGSEVVIKAPNKAAVEHAFKGHTAGGGTSYAEGIKVLTRHKPKDTEDALFIFVGDEGDQGIAPLIRVFEAAEFKPVAFGLLEVSGNRYGQGTIIKDAAVRLGIPCFQMDEQMFKNSDPYAIPRLLRNLVATTPVGEKAKATARQTRKSLVEEVLATPLLTKPVWA